MVANSIKIWSLRLIS